MKTYRIYVTGKTIQITTDEKNTILSIPPIYHRFIGYKIDQLIDWLNSKYYRVTVKYVLFQNMMYRPKKREGERDAKGNRRIICS